MRKPKRLDGLTYNVSESQGKFWIDLVDDSNEVINGWAIPFESEDQAWKAVDIADISFREGIRHGEQIKV